MIANHFKVSLESKPTIENLVYTASLHFGCYGPNWREKFLPIPHRFTPKLQSW